MAVKLYRYQREAVSFLFERDGFAGLFMEMGTGKTPTALSYLARRGAQRILVVCPLSVAGVWRDEIKKVGLPWTVLMLTRGTLESRAKRLSQEANMSSTAIVIVNYDSFWRYPAESKKVRNKEGKVEHVNLKLRGLRKAIRDWQPDAVIADEAHRLKGRMTKQSRFSHELRQLESVETALALTGTPVMNGIEDLFSIYKFIDPEIFGTSYPDFERRYVMRGGYGGYQILGYRNVKQVERKVASSAYQVSKADALDLPERVTTIVPVALEPKARAVYRQMQRDAIVRLEAKDEQGNPVRGKAIATIVLTALLRLQQITGGSLPIIVEGETSATDRVQMADVGDEKLKAAVELTQDALDGEQSVVIFCRFIRDIVRLLGSFPHHYRPGDSDRCALCGRAETAQHLDPEQDSYVTSISGSVSSEQREQRIKDLHTGKVKVLIVQVATGSLGIDLTAASVAIFYSTGYSLGEFLQARDRLHRHGQTKKVSEYLLQVEDSVDEKIFSALMNKQEIARLVTSLDYAKGLLGVKDTKPTKVKESGAALARA